MDLLYRLRKAFTFVAPLTYALTLCHKCGPKCCRLSIEGNGKMSIASLSRVIATKMLITNKQLPNGG